MRIEFGNLESQLHDYSWGFEQARGIDQWPAAERDARVEDLARLGDPIAQGYLAILYYRGFHGFHRRQGIGSPDYPNAFIWAQAAADKDDDAGLILLFILYFKGWGIEKDKAKAVTFLHRLTDRDDLEAMTLLGECHYLGQGVPESNEEALKWFHRAAQREFHRAEFNIGEMYLYGHGVPEDATLANQWKRRSFSHSPQGVAPGRRHIIGDDGL